MAKIFSILTLLVALVAIWLALEGDKRVKDMQSAGKRLVDGLKVTEGKLRDTMAELAKTQAELATTKADLATTTEKLRNAEAELATTKMNLTKATQDLEAKTAGLTSIMKQLDEVIPGGIKEIAQIKEKIAELTEKNKSQEMQIVTLTNEKSNLQTRVTDLEGTKKAQEEQIVQKDVKIAKYVKNIMIKNTRGRVEAVNAGWGFCVVSIGDKQGAAQNKILIVSRNGQSIGKVKITNVEATQSVADILPSTFVKGTMVAPGDSVIYTGEDKVFEEPVAGELPLPRGGQ